jgi:uncharacterized membrane protein YvbJ
MMALIQCKECLKEISKKASACPNCGAPTKWGKKTAKRERNKRRGNTQGAGCLLIILSIILGSTVVGTPIAIPLVIIGLVILVVGFFL